MRLLPSSLALALPVCVLASPAAAQSLVPAPDEATHDTALAAHMDGIARVQDGVLSLPVGFGLEGFVSDDAHRALVETFVASGMDDFEAATGQHPYAVLDSYGEQGDLGMFGGVQAAGLAWRYAVLRDRGGSAADVDRARAALLPAIEGLHWYTAVTGISGGVARGLMRVSPESGEPALPGGRPMTLPLFDASGAPQPADKVATWREDASGELPFLVWLDDSSKDQLDGYVLALGAVYDAIEGDASFDGALLARLQADCAAIGHALMQRVDVGRGTTADLVIVDADGRPTSFHDLSAEELTPGIVNPRPINGFNALMALGVMRTLYHVSGDAEIGRYYYEELVGARDYPASAAATVRLMYQGVSTNYSNVNMAFVAAFGVLRYETDSTVSTAARDILEHALYAPGVDREARGLGLPFFDFVYAGFRTGGASDDAGAAAIREGLVTLDAYRSAPLWDQTVINCDDLEIAAGSCLAVDGTTTLALLPDLARGGAVVAVDPVPLAVRPPSNFEHRSDPHRVNGSGGSRLDPGGDIVAAYWLGQLLTLEGGTSTVSPHARPALPWTPAAMRDAGTSRDGGATLDAAADVGPGSSAASGCACRAGRSRESGGAGPLALALGLCLEIARRRERPSR